MADDLTLKQLFDSHGNEIVGFSVFRAKRNILIRGDPKSTYRKCDVCGRHLYHPLGRWYILHQDWPNNGIRGDQFNGLVVPSEIASRVKQMKWKQIAITKLPVLDVAEDGWDIN